jgi:cytochrome c oxidase subunit 2
MLGKSMRFLKGFALVALLVATGHINGFIGSALANPVDGGYTLQPADTPVMEDIHIFHNDILMPIITIIVIFVAVLMAIVAIRFNRRANPTPSKTSHNTLLEVAWTVIPVMILVAIAIPSFRLLYKEVVVPKSDLTVKAIGHQWNWSYEYPDQGIDILSLMKEDADLKPGEPRLFTADAPMVVPVNTTVRVIVTSSDVIHSFAVPSFGVKVDAIPGRLNETWFRAEKTGMFYGQCSELCGTNHAFMPINIKVVSMDEYKAWVTEQTASADTNSKVKVADASAKTAVR